MIIVYVYCIKQNEWQILLPRTFHNIQIRCCSLIIDLNNVEFYGASFKSGSGFWFCQEVAEKSKTTNLAVILSHRNYKICDNSQSNPHSLFFVFLDQFISTSSNRNHSVSFRDLKLSTKSSLTTILLNTECVLLYLSLLCISWKFA